MTKQIGTLEFFDDARVGHHLRAEAIVEAPI